MRDIVYAIGYVPKNSRELKSLWMVYGDCYAADRDVYKKAENKVKNAIGNLNGLDVAPETNELSRINKVDPLNITYLRVRGMWVISNPNKVFAYLYEDDKNALFQMVCLIQSGKYKSFPQQDIQALESAQGVKIKDVDIRDPNNPANLLESKLIIYKMVA